jgi:hypothetical protein
MAQIHLINAEIKGRTYVASWHVEDERLHLSTVFASESITLGSKDPASEALKLLKKMIRLRSAADRAARQVDREAPNGAALSHS